jgi:hypothetical protein
VGPSLLLGRYGTTSTTNSAISISRCISPFNLKLKPCWHESAGEVLIASTTSTYPGPGFLDIMCVRTNPICGHHGGVDQEALHRTSKYVILV